MKNGCWAFDINIVTVLRYFSSAPSRFKLKWEELQKEHKDLSAKFSAFEEDKKDIVEYLKHSLLQREEEVDVLKQRVESLVEASTEEREAMQVQLIEMTKDLRERAEKLTVENEALGEQRSMSKVLTNGHTKQRSFFSRGKNTEITEILFLILLICLV